jgi:hypothetical protein
MTWQLWAVAGLALASAAFLGTRAWRAWTSECGSGCGKCGTPGEAKEKLIPADDLLARVRARGKS